MRAAELGADYLGVILVPGTPRFVTPEEAREVLDFSPRPPAIGVFRDAPRNEIERAARIADLQGFQLHGRESPEDCRGLPGYTIRVVGVHDASSLEGIDDYDTDAILCDTSVAGKSGGTGQLFDHTLVVDLARRRTLFLAGGLNPDNAVEAARLVQPFAIDVSSGLEAEPRLKDHTRMAIFFARLREAGLR
ncbi:phosphoribosylanthranilate isomerase [Candidatus Sumerlaeota bacterium]|nr:phosphoribosylanthranilate isomerase [Candidatus Sumerlaeota bacterium]